MFDGTFADTRRRRRIVWCLRILTIVVVVGLQVAALFPLSRKLSELGLALSGFSLAWAMIAALLVVEALTRPQKHLARYKVRVRPSELPKASVAFATLYPLVRALILIVATANFLIYFEEVFPGIAFTGTVPSAVEIDGLAAQCLAVGFSLNEWHPTFTHLAFSATLLGRSLEIATAIVFVGTVVSVLFAWLHARLTLGAAASTRKIKTLIWKAGSVLARVEADERERKLAELPEDVRALLEAQRINFHYAPFAHTGSPEDSTIDPEQLRAGLKAYREQKCMSQEEFDELRRAVADENNAMLVRLMSDPEFMKRFARTYDELLYDDQESQWTVGGGDPA